MATSRTCRNLRQVRATGTLLESDLAAGAPDAGIDLLRRAADDAQQSADSYLLARALLEFGSALVHIARGYAEEGATYLDQATDLVSGAALPA